MFDWSRCLICKESFVFGEMVMVVTGGYIGKLKDREVPITVANHRSEFYTDNLGGAIHTRCLLQLAEARGVVRQ